MFLIGFGLACCGCFLLSISLKRHFLQVWPDSGQFERRYMPARTAGYACIALSLVACSLARGIWIGLVLWPSMLALAAFVQAMLLTWLPRQSTLFGVAGACLVLAGTLA